MGMEVTQCLEVLGAVIVFYILDETMASGMLATIQNDLRIATLRSEMGGQRVSLPV
jgi:hypothetical protein